MLAKALLFTRDLGLLLRLCAKAEQLSLFGDRQEVQKPGSQGGKYYVTQTGNIRYGEKPHPTPHKVVDNAQAVVHAVPQKEEHRMDEQKVYKPVPKEGRWANLNNPERQLVARLLAEGKTDDEAERAITEPKELAAAAAEKKAVTAEKRKQTAAAKLEGLMAALSGIGIKGTTGIGERTGKRFLTLRGDTKPLREIINKHGGKFYSQRAGQPDPRWSLMGERGVIAFLDEVVGSGSEATRAKVSEQQRSDAEHAAQQAEAKRHQVQLNVPYEHREIAKKHGARWSPDIRRWVAPDEETAGKVYAELDKVKAPAETNARATTSSPAISAPPPPRDPSIIDLHGGSGYGHDGWDPGQVIYSAKHGGYYKILTAKKRYYREDGMSFGVGDESGHVYWATARPATSEEAAPLAAERAKREAEHARSTRIKSISNDIQARGVRPEGTNVPTGVRLFDTQNIYGGGDWFVVDGPTVWYVRNNGADGDTWDANNVRTGGAGAIGWRVEDQALASELMELASANRKAA